MPHAMANTRGSAVKIWDSSVMAVALFKTNQKGELQKKWHLFTCKYKTGADLSAPVFEIEN
jgi:hypothetical protein